MNMYIIRLLKCTAVFYQRMYKFKNHSYITVKPAHLVAIQLCEESHSGKVTVWATFMPISAVPYSFPHDSLPSQGCPRNEFLPIK